MVNECCDQNSKIPEFVQVLSNAIPCASAEQALKSLKESTWVNPDVDFSLDWAVSDFRDNYLYSEFLSKFPHFRSVSSPKERALKDFRDQEEINRLTNARLRADLLPRYSSVIKSAQQRVQSLLGPVRSAIPYCIQSGYYGPGTNVGLESRRSALLDKVSKIMTCTPALAGLSTSLINESDMLARCCLRADGPVSLLTADEFISVVGGAKLTTVPKNAKTDRTITIEPMLNSWLQNGVGRFLRQRLLRVGIDLRDQGRNQRLSADYKNFATIDLKQASNSLTTSLVFLLLQQASGWYEFLNLLRSKAFTLDKGRTYTDFQLFAGMGNGFTFPLETIAFWALSRAVMDSLGYQASTLAVYGDDIIVPLGCVNTLKDVLGYVGLEVNMKKTHSTGLFRESCGSHSYQGVDVKPFYVRNELKTERDFVQLHNAVWRWAQQDKGYFDSRVFPVLRWLRSHAKGYSLVHPDLGDVGFAPCKSLLSTNGVRAYRCVNEKATPEKLRGVNGFWLAFESAQMSTTGSPTTLPEFQERDGESVVSCDSFVRRNARLKTKVVKTFYPDYYFNNVII